MNDQERWITKNGKRFKINISKYMNDKIRKPIEYKDDYEYLIDGSMESDDLYNDMSDESYYSDLVDKEDIRLIHEWYVGDGYSTDLNRHLREDDVFAVDKPVIKAMDKACKTYTAKQKMAGTRFVDMDYLRNAYKLDIPYGQIDRSKVADQMREFLGSELSSKAYTSISLNESGNGMFNNLAVKMKINMPKGTKMYVADNLSEYEAILGRNKKMILKKVDFKDSNVEGLEKEYGKILLTYEVVEDDKD